MSYLDKIMCPHSLAVIGASNKEHTIGSDIMKRLVEYGFTGKIFPINPKDSEIQGMKAYPSVLEVPEEIDMAVIVINAKYVLSAVDQCHRKGIKGIVVISAKTTPKLQHPARFAESLPVRGDIGFVSQSGALGGGILNILQDLNLGFAQFISIGNQAHVNADSAIEYWENVDDVKQILLYMESIADPKRFRTLASRTTKKKPILALKAGRSAAGASAASSHTGSLAGADKAADALLKQSGVIREFSLQDLFNTAKVFSHCPIPKGNRVAIVTNSGGPGIMATDAVCEHGMEMAQLSDQTKEALRSFLPAAASVKNPVDMIASAPLEHYKKTLETVLADDGVDMVVVIYLPFLGLKDIDVAKAVMEIRAAHPDKPIVGVFMTKNEFFAHLSETQVNVPFFMFAEQAVEGLARLNQQRLWRKRTDTPAPRYSVDTEAVEAVFKQAAADNREQLTTGESLQVLTAYGIRVCRDGEAKDADEAVALADKIGYPVVMKLNSKKISHKTDIGGVRVGIKDAAQLRTEFADLVTKLTEKGLMDGFEGVIIQEMVKSDREMVCGCAKDPQYGQMMMFGLGGVFVEVMKDVTFRLAPLTVEDASDMIHSVKAYKLLAGARGATPAQINKVEETLLRLSQLVEDFAFIDELDINPLMISDKDGEPIAVDGRIKFNATEALVALSIA